MDKNPPEEAGAGHGAAVPGAGGGSCMPGVSAQPAGAGESAVRWEVRAAPRTQGVSPELAALLPLPAVEDVVGRPVLEQLAALVRGGRPVPGRRRRGGPRPRRRHHHGRSTVDWVVCHSRGRIPAARAAQLLRVARCAQQTGLTPQPERDSNSDGDADDGSEGATRPASGWESVYEAFTSGELPLDKADRIGRFQADVRPIATEEDIAADATILIAAACDDEYGQGVTVPELARAIIVAGQYLKPAALLEKGEAAARAARALHRCGGPAGMTTYRVLMDPEGAATIDAAAAFSHPVRSADGERDPRTSATRRADALLQVLQHGVAAGAPPTTGTSATTSTPATTGSPASGPRGEKAQIIVTIDYAQLQERVRGAGLTTTGQVLSPATIRRLACEAGILPMVLGADTAPLDVGRTQRLFTGPLRKAILRRDKCCTWAGCTLPGAWCHVHHNDWWSRGGPTSYLNGAALCPPPHPRPRPRPHRRHLHHHRHLAQLTTTPHTPPPPGRGQKHA